MYVLLISLAFDLFKKEAFGKSTGVFTIIAGVVVLIADMSVMASWLINLSSFVY